MRLLVTGANGFIGKTFSRLAKNKGYQLIRVVRPDATRGEKLGMTKDHDELLTISDIGPETEWGGLLAGVDGVVHLAAKVHVTPPECADLADFRRVNVMGTERLVSQAARAGVRHLVFLSTVKVNGEKTLGIPFTETIVPTPHDAYGISKWEAEQALMRISAETNLEVVVLRSPLAYGPEVKGNFLRLLKLVNAGVPLPLAQVQNQRSFIYVGNLVDAIIRCIEHPAAAGQTFLVSDGEDLSTPDLILRMGRALGHPARLWPFPPVLLHVAAKLMGKSADASRLLCSLQVDSSKISKELGWKPPYSMDEGLTETAKWFLSQARMNAP